MGESRRDRPGPPAFGPAPEPPSPEAGDHRSGSRWAALLVFLFGLALYIGTVEYDFVWDDHLQIESNQYITQVRYLPRFFTHDLTQMTSGAMHAPYYRPLLWVSLLLDYRAWGFRPAGFHLTNALLYALACLLVFRLARPLLGDHGPAVLAALLFAAHPTHVETIANVSGRIEAMATIGLLLAVLGYQRSRLAEGWRRHVATAGSLAAFVFGLLSKETAISLPLILVWSEVLFRGEAPPEGSSRLGGIVARLAPFFAVSLGLLWFRWSAVARWTAEAAGPATLWERWPGSLELIARYALLAVLPLRLQPVYDLPRPTSLWAPWPLAGLGVVVLVGGFALWGRRRWPVACFGLGWFLIALGPVLDLVPVAKRAMNFAPRYLFVSTIGLALLAGAALTRLLAARDGRVSGARPRGSPRTRVAWVTGVASVLVFLGWTATTLGYMPLFRDDLRLFARVARDVPGIAQGHQNLGLALLRAGRKAEGLRALERAAAAEPNDAFVRLALARSYVTSGHAAEGFRLLDDLEPRIGEAYAYVRTRATSLLEHAEWGAAVEVLTRGLGRYPESSPLHFLLGYALENLDDLPRAEAAYRQALWLYPSFPGGRLALARLLIRADRPAEADALARAARDLEPRSPAAWRAQAQALEALGDAAGSRKAWERVLELDDAPEARAEARRHLSTVGGPKGPLPAGSP